LKLDHVRLLADDFGETYRFYSQTLGLATTFGDESGPYASFDTGDAAVTIFERRFQRETVDLQGRGDGCLVILRVGDVDAEAQRLGLAEPVSRADWGIRVTYVRDPAGNLLELYSAIPMQE
jgi:catechol 2,3-dioxygenase-like lactoylglutathione lyase family enzyme